jgi:hypothetical protein
LKENLKTVETERSRLISFKKNKVEQMKEVEAKVKKYDTESLIDMEKLVN